MFIDYDDCILNYLSAIRSYFKIDYYSKPNQEFLDFLNKHQFKQIIYILIDGMGSRLIERYLNDNDFLKKHLLKKTTTIFPPTTTAATTAILNGKSPNQTLWLGWSQYLKQVDDTIVPFLAKSYYDDREYEAKIFNKYYPTNDIIAQLNEHNIKAKKIMPSFDPEYGLSDFSNFYDEIIKASKEKKERFIYAYNPDYDTLMHKYGPSSKEAIELLKKINDDLERVANETTKDTLLIISADHGQVDVRNIDISKEEYTKYYLRKPCLEPRALNFFIKKEHLEDFRKAFLKKHEADVILLSKKEILDSKLFGYGTNHPDLEEMLGDFLAIAKTDANFITDPKFLDLNFKGSHAGCHPDELFIPLILYYQS